MVRDIMHFLVLLRLDINSQVVVNVLYVLDNMKLVRINLQVEISVIFGEKSR